MSEHGYATDEVERIESEVRDYVAQCAERALASPMPEPGDALDGVFAARFEPLGDGVARWSRWTAGNGMQNGAGNGRAAA